MQVSRGAMKVSSVTRCTRQSYQQRRLAAVEKLFEGDDGKSRRFRRRFRPTIAVALLSRVVEYSCLTRADGFFPLWISLPFGV